MKWLDELEIGYGVANGKKTRQEKQNLLLPSGCLMVREQNTPHSVVVIVKMEN